MHCGLLPEKIAQIGYNRVGRFLPTGGTTLGLDEVGLEVIGSLTEPVQSASNAKRAKLMSTHCAGKKFSLEAKERFSQPSSSVHIAPRAVAVASVIAAVYRAAELIIYHFGFFAWLGVLPLDDAGDES